MSFQLKKRPRLLPRIKVSSIHVYSSDQPAPASAQYSSSLVSVWDFSAVEDVVNFFIHQTNAETVTFAVTAPLVPPYDQDLIPSLALFSS